MAKCLYCSDVFQPSKGLTNYCSYQCRNAANSTRLGEIECVQCGVRVPRGSAGKRFCGPQCKRAAIIASRQQDLPCSWCGKFARRTRSGNHAAVCTNACRAAWRQYSLGKTSCPYPRIVARCEFDGCGRDVARSGLCAGHYSLKIKGQRLRPLAKRRASGVLVPCAADDCDRASRAAGYCGTHYNQFRKHGVTQPIRGPRVEPERASKPAKQPKPARTPAPCAFEDCPKTAGKTPLCPWHRKMLNRYGSLHPLNGVRRPKVQRCSFDECSEFVASRGYCTGHYRQHLRGVPLRPLFTGNRGFNPHASAWLYVVTDGEVTKLGVTNYPISRLAAHRRQGLVTVLHLIGLDRGLDVAAMERLWVEFVRNCPEIYRVSKRRLRDGYTEAVYAHTEASNMITDIIGLADTTADRQNPPRHLPGVPSRS